MRLGTMKAKIIQYKSGVSIPSEHSWIWEFLENRVGLLVAWEYQTATVSDIAFQPLIAHFDDQMVVLVDTGVHAKTGDPPTMKCCGRSTWNGQMLIETIFSMLTLISHVKQVMHRTWDYVRIRLAFTVAIFNILMQCGGFKPDATGMAYRSLPPLSL